MLRIRSSTEALLNSVLWMMSAATKPTLAQLLNHDVHPTSRPQLNRLVDGGYLSRKKDSSGQWVYALTRAGSIAALGGRVPTERWERPWDGNWRFILFDLPRGANNERRKLHRWLRMNQFGCAQNSVWVTPDPFEAIAPEIEGLEALPESLLQIEGITHPRSKEHDRDLVEKAWDFGEINRRYNEYLKVAKSAPKSASPEAQSQIEHRAWIHAVRLDPMLPASLHPDTYAGVKAWARREAGLQRSGIGL